MAENIELSTSFYFEIQADDLGKASNFYKEVFGWEFEKVKGLPIEYMRIKAGRSNGGLLKRPVKTPPPEYGTNAFVCSMEVKNFDESEKKILNLGGITALPKFAVPGTCWQGYFIDLDGNTFGIFQPDPEAK